MSDDIYLQFGIDSSKLKRDYIKNPIEVICGKRNPDKPYKEDLEYLYIELNISVKDLMIVFNKKKGIIERWLRYYNIKKDKRQAYKIYSKIMFEKYGVRHGFQSTIIKNKSIQTLNKKYGVSNISQTKEWKEKIKNNSEKIHDKMYKTMILSNNLSLHNSKPENKIYELLCSKYKEVKRQYKSSLYPYRCDFYIPEIDTYIEYQGYWTHGFEPYIGSKEQQKKIKLWESKNTSQYKKAIKDWTNKDVEKRKTAKNNGLNWIEFFNMEQFNKWFYSSHL